MKMEKTIKEGLKVSGKILMANFGRVGVVRVKENQSNIVTQSDIASERAIIRIIRQNFPDHDIISEEMGYRTSGSEYIWVIDPLDGTSNFTAGIPWFGVIIAIMKDFKPLVGGIYLPHYDELYLAEKGRGASRNGKKISVTNERNMKNVLVAYSLDYADITKTEHEVRIIKALVQNSRNIRATNSVVDWCYVAAGKLGASINQTTKIWDIAAPYLLIKEAGGIVTNIDGNDIDFSVTKSSYKRNFTFVGSSKFLHSGILELIKKVSQ